MYFDAIFNDTVVCYLFHTTSALFSVQEGLCLPNEQIFSILLSLYCSVDTPGFVCCRLLKPCFDDGINYLRSVSTMLIVIVLECCPNNCLTLKILL